MSLPSTATITIDSATQGRTLLKHVSEFDPKDTGAITGVATLGGFVIGGAVNPGEGIPITLTSYLQEGKQECDWYALRQSQEFFKFELRFSRSIGLQYLNVRVASINPKPDVQGKHTLQIECFALRVEKL